MCPVCLGRLIPWLTALDTDQSQFCLRRTMKKLITILIGASLAFTAAMAQQDNPDATPAKKKKQQRQQQQQQQQRAQPGEQQRQPQQGRMQQRRQQPQEGQGQRRGERGNRNRQEQQANPQAPNDVNANQNAGNAPEQQQRKNRPQQANQRAKSPEPATGSAATATRQNENTAAAQPKNRRGTANAKPDTQTVQQIKRQHTDFHAQAKPQKVPAVTYQQNYRITNAEHWQGPQYAAFRTYRPAWHDHTWWHAHFPTIVLIGGGYYYWNAGFWYPAWGYDPGASYYAYDG